MHQRIIALLDSLRNQKTMNIQPCPYCSGNDHLQISCSVCLGTNIVETQETRKLFAELIKTGDILLEENQERYNTTNEEKEKVATTRTKMVLAANKTFEPIEQEVFLAKLNLNTLKKAAQNKTDTENETSERLRKFLQNPESKQILAEIPKKLDKALNQPDPANYGQLAVIDTIDIPYDRLLISASLQESAFQHIADTAQEKHGAVLGKSTLSCENSSCHLFTKTGWSRIVIQVPLIPASGDTPTIVYQIFKDTDPPLQFRTKAIADAVTKSEPRETLEWFYKTIEELSWNPEEIPNSLPEFWQFCRKRGLDEHTWWRFAKLVTKINYIQIPKSIKLPYLYKRRDTLRRGEFIARLSEDYHDSDPNYKDDNSIEFMGLDNWPIWGA